MLPLLAVNMTKEYRDYLRTRGISEYQGFFLIPHECQHLSGNLCNIHESPDRPKVCRVFHGQKRIGMMKIYIPPECTYLVGNDGSK